ncbi:hypothetical protein [Helicobacter mustelae]|uniref:Putative inner membrane protein n=1 Tax=Helicobacter mustelae (strain ATCC 43772 / CCUG 25715 / CIP 103759 / LMG 18044 / NCTC 12198 / R85-136P) TaxID=679897 RepID=D3UH03_HELM1|nr:hypothetical protein [Helicobacter mustelae]CBG39775.1 Putative inner membrane protein [Helicobacter mustelae 12198]SQH71284.1 Uncharacterised protein [Helicobacter mustelae]STP12409.1 Uncharacterised protein [Helicobacter mustelae]
MIWFSLLWFVIWRFFVVCIPACIFCAWACFYLIEDALLATICAICICIVVVAVWVSVIIVPYLKDLLQESRDMVVESTQQKVFGFSGFLFWLVWGVVKSVGKGICGLFSKILGRRSKRP